MPARFGRAIVTLALAPWLVCAPALPQEHFHEADVDHPQSITHRHAALHAVESTDHDGPEFEHSEDRVLWLSSAGLVQSTYHLEGSWTVVGKAFAASPRIASWIATAACDTSPPHGPPRPTRSPRAPPPASRLI